MHRNRILTIFAEIADWLRQLQSHNIRKAFDLINHRILINKLEINGIPPHLLRWLAAFLCDRHQQVKIGKELSSSGSPNGGVPQGTLSGPKYFLIYI